MMILSFSYTACNNSSSQPIKFNVDKCDYCAMTIADGRFGAELITQKKVVATSLMILNA
jgi:copper chaperone NosL